MKLGFYFPNIRPIKGGSFTFISGFIAGLEKIAQNSKHEILIFHASKKYQKPQNSNISYVYVSDYTRSFDIFDSIIKSIILSFSGIRLKNSTSLNYYMKRYDVELAIFFTPIHPHVDLPFVTTIWDFEHLKQPWFPEVSGSEYYKREKYYQHVLPLSSLVITGTKEGKKEVCNFYSISEKNVRVIPFPTPDFSSFTSINSKKNIEELGISKAFILYPAQFWAHKNHINLLYAFKHFLEKYSYNIELVLVGSDKGNKKNVKEMIKSLHIEDNVKILGFVSSEDLYTLYQNASLLVYLSYFGPDNLPPLEAFSMECPVIAGDIPGAKEQLGDAALLVDPNNIQDIADSIQLLLNEFEIRREYVEKGTVRANSWTTNDYLEDLFVWINSFEKIRRNWR